MSETPQSFGDFYSGIRSHFSTNVWEYEKFKQCKGNRAKVEYLIGHAVVQKALATLSSRNSQIPLCSIFGLPSSKSQEEKCRPEFPPSLIQGKLNKKYPQMSRKIEVKANKKKGRMLVAKEQIEPGKYLLFL